MTKAKLLEVRKEINKRRPKFLRQNYHFRKKVEDDLWRAPKGYHSKMRQHKRSHRKIVQMGYRNPVEVRGLHKSGAKFVYIQNMAALEKFNPKEEVAILSGKVGDKKRYDLLKAAVQKKISFTNIDAAKFIANFDAKQKIKKELKAVKPKSEAKPEKPKAEAKAEIGEQK
jgi:large subunit ribosomal protein L32e